VSRILKETSPIEESAIVAEQKRFGFFGDPRLNLIKEKYKKDYTFLNVVFDELLSSLPTNRRTFLYDRLLELFPDDIELCLRASEHELRTGNIFRARSLVVAALKVSPTNPTLWNTLITLELTEDRMEEARALYNAAISEVPLCADLRKKFVDFETKQGNTKYAKEIVDAGSALGLLL